MIPPENLIELPSFPTYRVIRLLLTSSIHAQPYFIYYYQLNPYPFLMKCPMCKQDPCQCLSSKSCKAFGLLALRVAIGVIFIMHGYGKLFGDAPGMTAFTGMVAGLGFPAPALFAYAAALTEFVGGIAVLVGVFTRFFSALIAVVMLVALLAVKKFALPQADVDLALLMISIALFCMGPGKYSLSAMMKKGGNGGECCKGGHDHNHGEMKA